MTGTGAVPVRATRPAREGNMVARVAHLLTVWRGREEDRGAGTRV